MWSPTTPKPDPKAKGVSHHIDEANRLLREILQGTDAELRVVLENPAANAAKEEAARARAEAAAREIALLKDERDRLLTLLEKTRPGPTVQSGQPQSQKPNSHQQPART